PVPFNADQGRPGRLVKGVVRIVTASVGRVLHQFICRITALRRVDLSEADSQTALAGKQYREIGRIDLREIPEDVNQTAETARDGNIHAFPDDRLRLRIVFRISAVVQDFDQPD